MQWQMLLFELVLLALLALALLLNCLTLPESSLWSMSTFFSVPCFTDNGEFFFIFF